MSWSALVNNMFEMMEDKRKENSEKSDEIKLNKYLEEIKDDYTTQNENLLSDIKIEQVLEKIAKDNSDHVPGESLSALLETMPARDRSIIDRQLSIDLPLSIITNVSFDKLIASSEASCDIFTTASELSCDVFTSSPTIYPPVHLTNPGPIRSSSSGSVVQHLNIPLLCHLDPHNNG